MQRHGRYPCRLPGCKPAFLLQATGFLGCPYHRIRPRSCQLSSAHNKSAHCLKPTISIFLLSSDSMSFLTLLSRAGRVGNVAGIAELACSSPFDRAAAGRRQLPLSSPEVATSLTAEIGDFSTVCRKQTHVLQLTIFFFVRQPCPLLAPISRLQCMALMHTNIYTHPAYRIESILVKTDLSGCRPKGALLFSSLLFFTLTLSPVNCAIPLFLRQILTHACSNFYA